MKEVVVISGKGGTGKTSITSSFAVLGGAGIVVGDCDVDADDMHLLLQPDYSEKEDFYSGFEAVIDQDICTGCGQCSDICRFNAVDIKDGVYTVNNLNCEGCGYCYEICPVKAIEMKDAYVGQVFSSRIKTGAVMIHARLKAGADNSGKLVARVKKKAKMLAQESGHELIIIDGSPGIGCPVVSSLTGADYVILVTEPTPSGIHDLKRVYELVSKFKIRAGLIINKYDLNAELDKELEEYAAGKDIKILTRLPYDETFTAAITNGITVAEIDNSDIQKMILNAWKNVQEEVFTGGKK